MRVCARVLAAALMVGAIATALAVPGHYGRDAQLPRAVSAPPTTRLRTIRLPQRRPPAASPALARRRRAPGSASFAELASLSTLGATQAAPRPTPTPVPPPAPAPRPVPPPRPVPAPVPAPQPTPAPSPAPSAPAAQPPPRELAGEPTPAPTPTPAPPPPGDGKDSHGRGHDGRDGDRPDRGKAPHGGDAEHSDPPRPATAPPSVAPPPHGDESGPGDGRDSEGD